MRAAAFAVLVSALFGCNDALLTYPLEGELYNEADDCLDEEGVIDIIEGEAEGTCEGVRCFRSLESGDYFVTEHCEPPPGYEDHSSELGGVCEKALAAHALGAAGRCQ